MSKEAEYNIISAWRQAIVLSARARRTQSDVEMDPLISKSLRAQISQSQWHRDMRSVTGTLCSNHGEPCIPGLTLQPQLSEKPERETKVRVLSNHNFSYHENPDEFLNDPRLVRAMSHTELEALVKIVLGQDCPTLYSWQIAVEPISSSMVAFEQSQSESGNCEQDRFTNTESMDEGHLDLHITVAVTSEPSVADHECKPGLTPEDGEKSITHIESAMHMGRDLRIQEDKESNQHLSPQEQIDRTTLDLTKILQRVSSRRGIIDGHIEKRYEDYQVQGRTFILPSIEDLDHLRSSTEMKDDDSCLAKRGFVLRSSAVPFQLSQDDIRTMIKSGDDLIAEWKYSIWDNDAKDAADLILNFQKDDQHSMVKIRDFLTQDVSANFPEPPSDNEEEEKEDHV
ncbi:hypothetical protein V866_006701 [Kwoniella sp. B9012]